jgi:uncharacterized ubiquitin-like protein YukD
MTEMGFHPLKNMIMMVMEVQTIQMVTVPQII